jgi:hypothetical protein
VDPLAPDYPELTVYQFASNTPIQAIDLDGLESYHYTLTFDDNGKTNITLDHVDDIIDKIYKSSPSGNYYHLEKTCTNCREEHTVSFTYTDFYVTDVLAGEYDVTKSKTYKTNEEAYNASVDDIDPIEEGPLADFKTGFMEGLAQDGIGRKGRKGKIKSYGYKGPNPNGKPRRPYLRKSTIKKAWKEAQDKDGKVFDPNDQNIELKWDKSKKRKGQWDMGHQHGKEFKRDWSLYKAGKVTWGKLKEIYNDWTRYQPEDPKLNQSHKHEDKRK